MIIKIQDDLVKYTCFRDTVEGDCKNVGDGIALLMDKYPQLYVFLLDNDGAEAKAVSVKLDGEFVWHPDTCERKCSASTELVFGREVPSGEGKSAQRWIGAGLIIIGAILNFTPLAFLSPYFYVSGASMILGSLVPTPKLSAPGINDSLSDSPTYSFSGVKNSSAPGTPIQLVYGKHRTGGHQLNIYTNFEEDTQPAFASWVDEAGVTRFVQYSTLNNDDVDSISYLNGQIGVSEGEVASITDLEVNGLPVSYFGDTVTTEVRAGTRSQVVIDGFSGIENTTSSGRLITRNDYTTTTTVSNPVVEIPVRGYVKVDAHAFRARHDKRADNDHAWMMLGFLRYPPYPEGAIVPMKEGVNDTLNGGTNAMEERNERLEFKERKWELKKGLYRLKAGSQPGYWTIKNGWYYYVPGEYEQCPPDEAESAVLLKWDFWTSCALESNPDNIVKGADGVTMVLTADQNAVATKIVTNPSQAKVVHETTSPCEGFRVSVNAPALYTLDSNNQQVPATVEITIAYREVNEALPDSRPWTVAVYKDALRGMSAGEIGRTYTIGDGGSKGKLPLAYYEIAVIRETEEAKDLFKTRDSIYLKEVTELTYQTLSYPHTALLGVKIKATDQLSGQVPTITSLVKGIKVAVPTVRLVNGEYNRDYVTYPLGATPLTLSTTKVWTDNPVWCLYDLLTNTRYGLGNFYKIDANKRGLMLANFYQMAKYCDEQLPTVDENGKTSTDTGWIPTYVTRFKLNIVIDQSKTAAEWIQTIAATMRASCYYSNGIFSIDIDRKKPITQIFNMTTLKEFSQTGASLRSIPNVYEVQFPDPDKSYTIDTFRIEDAALLSDSSIEERKAALQLIGVTDRRQCKSLARYALEAGRTLTKMVSFKTDRRALYSQVGDVIGIQHDVPQWGFGGVIKDVAPISGALELSDDFLPGDAPGQTYEIRLVKGDGRLSTDTALTYASSADGIIRVVTPATFLTDPELGEVQTLTPEIGDRYVIGSTNAVVNPFRITMIKEGQDGLFEINCVQYNASIYDAADDLRAGPAEAVPDYSLLVPMTRDPVSGVSAKVKTYIDGAGFLKQGIEVFYQAPFYKANWAGCTLYYKLQGSSTYLSKALSSSGYFFIEEVQDGTYSLVLPSTWKDGSHQTPNEALTDNINRPYTTVTAGFITELVESPEVDWSIRGLQIENAGNSEEFTGKDCIITWRRPRLLGQNEEAGEGSNGKVDTGNWILGYQVEVLNSNGTVRRSSTVTSERFIYSSEMNHQDGVTRSFRLRVATIASGGHISTPATISANNPPPAAVQGLLAEGLVASYRVTFTPSADLDIVGYKIYASPLLEDLDVAPGASIEEFFLINKGPETSLSVTAPVGGDYFVRVAAYDTFGDQGLTYSPIVMANVKEEIPYFLELFEGQLSENQLYSDLNERINLIDAEGTGLVSRADGWDTEIGDLRQQYTVKIDNNGFMTGFGLASEDVDGIPFSEFIVSADRFAMVNPLGSHYTISSITRAGTVMTVNTTFAHGLVVNDHCTVTGSAQHEYNGTWKVATVPTATSLTITISTTPISPATLKDPLKPMQLWKAVVPFLIQDGKTYIDSALVGSIRSALLYAGYPAWEFDTAGLFTMRHADGSILMQAGEKIKATAIYEYSETAPTPTSITAPTFS
jgi:hypothetical protein